jgi:glycosyltransferase involved in cell wall biosynthesis
MTSQENLVEDANTCPRVTYVIAAYNAETTLGDALDSLTRQRCADWAAIVVDDGSTDGTLEIACARAQQDERVQVLSQANAGPAKARNAGVEHAHSEFVACLDADDELTDDHLSTMLDLVGRNPDFEVYGSDGCFVHPDGSRVPVFGYSDIRSLALEDVLAGSPIMGGGTLIRTDAFRALGGFRSEIYCEDYDLWLRALTAGCRHIAT